MAVTKILDWKFWDQKTREMKFTLKIYFYIWQCVMVLKAIAACGSTPENVAKVIMIENQLSKKGAQSRFISDALKHLASYDEDREKVIALLENAFHEDKLTEMMYS